MHLAICTKTLLWVCRSLYTINRLAKKSVRCIFCECMSSLLYINPHKLSGQSNANGKMKRDHTGMLMFSDMHAQKYKQINVFTHIHLHLPMYILLWYLISMQLFSHVFKVFSRHFFSANNHISLMRKSRVRQPHPRLPNGQDKCRVSNQSTSYFWQTKPLLLLTPSVVWRKRHLWSPGLHQ